MRVGVYSRWIDTLGGGEQTLGAFAATLAEHHDVDLITHEVPDWTRFQDTLGFDLRDLTTRVVPYDRDHYRPLQTATKDYDLFINCSYLDPVRAYARVNVLQVFFPPGPPPVVSGVTPLPRPAEPDRPRLQAIAGLHPLERDDAGTFAWTDGDARFALDAPPGSPVRLTLRLASARPRELAPATVDIAIDGTTVRTARLPARGYVDLEIRAPAELVQGSHVFVDVHSDTFDPSGSGADDRAALGVRVAAAVADADPPPRRRGRALSPSAGLERWTDHRRYVDAIGTYDMLLSNSHFTQRWVARRYGRASELLYPPVQVGQFAPAQKQQRIISVGRFFVDGHTKKQLEMIQLFRRLCDNGLTGWDYHLAGGTHHDSRSARYFEDCRSAAVGYPITLHPDAPLSELVELYAGSALYWNATGYGEDQDLEPDRFEHFGMTTVEAMASGCVPLSYDRAGQPEVIEHAQSGILWETLDELAEQTLALIADPRRRHRLAAAAQLRSKSFTYARFRETLQRLLADTDLYR
jgi:glycosyltransferase involved in cell wall biosynthesis